MFKKLVEMKPNSNSDSDSQSEYPNPYFSNDKLDEDKIFVEIPSEQKPVYHERLTSGFDPMGEVYLEGRVYRGISGGRTPWWVLFTAWVIFGGMFFMLLSAAFASPGLVILLPLLIASLPVLITLRGTLAKLSNRKQRRG
jgi:hypothetical protein